MSNIGKYDFSETSREKIIRLAELTSNDEKFITDALRFISLKTFNNVLKNAEKEIIEELKTYADNPELFQSCFRSKIDEAKVKEAYTAIHNEYISGFIENCGGNYSDAINDEIKGLKF